ncbi:MAG: peptide deformylase [Proteobacteria bacterium]|nr:peptide deformylase [Pseudomonadota bacterium]
MAIREILTYPEPLLKKLSKPVDEVGDEIKTLISDMLETMYEAPGVGLAAPQVGVLKRVIVLDIEYKEGERQPIVLVNPEIIESSGETTYEEGCLSIPEYNAEVVRASEVTVNGLDGEGHPLSIKADGLLAIALQHEIDHLDGILFVDRLGSMKRDIFRRKYKKLMKERAEAS